jgi:NAD(P)-dependent dehydrogenase (short-subunit alcohol dehydrogenase family)
MSCPGQSRFISSAKYSPAGPPPKMRIFMAALSITIRLPGVSRYFRLKLSCGGESVELAGRHALVTGGGRGIGAAIAASLTAQGARVTVLGRTEATLARAMSDGIASDYVVADVTDAAALEGIEAVDILVNNAGAAESVPLSRSTRAHWDAMLAVNLTSAFEACRAIAPGMVKRGHGRIVNVASTAGLRGYPYVAAYCAAKHGLIGLTRALAMEFATTGVTVNAVCPGWTETDLLTGAAERVAATTGRSAESVLAHFAQSNPQGRLITPAQVADAVLFLCRPGAGAMTGQAIAVAGGEVM